MGLDLMMFTKSAYDEYKKTEDYKVLTPEVLYGRKTWSLYYFFRNCVDTKVLDEEIYEISREAFEDFEKNLHPYKDCLEAILDEDFDWDEEVAMVDEMYNSISDMPASLGEDWDVRCFARWYEALPAIYQIYDSGDSLVMLASY